MGNSGAIVACPGALRGCSVREWAKSGPSLSRGLSKDFLPLAQIDQFSKRQHLRPPANLRYLLWKCGRGATLRRTLHRKKCRELATSRAALTRYRLSSRKDPPFFPAPQNIESARPRADIFTASSEGPFIAITGHTATRRKSKIGCTESNRFPYPSEVGR